MTTKKINKKHLIRFILVAALIPAAFLVGLSMARAGMYHATSDETGDYATDGLACSQCHTMHGTQGGSSTMYDEPSIGQQPLQDKLLRASSVLALCRICHGDPQIISTVEGGKTPPKVENHNKTNRTPSAGDFMDEGADNHWNKHNVGDDISGFEPPGWDSANSWTSVISARGATFTCIYCHDQHGNKNYRNLRHNPAVPASDIEGDGAAVVVSFRTGVGNCSDGVAAPCDVFVDDSAGSNLWKYERANVTFKGPVSTDNDDPLKGMAAWCGKCHVDFFGISGDSKVGGTAGGDLGAGDTSNPWKRHPVKDIDIASAANNRHADQTNWIGLSQRVRATDPDTTATIDGDEQPFCLTCHYAHGGGNPNFAGNAFLDHSMLVMTDDEGDVNLERRTAAGGTYDESAGRMRNTCNQCHNQ